MAVCFELDQTRGFLYIYTRRHLSQNCDWPDDYNDGDGGWTDGYCNANHCNSFWLPKMTRDLGVVLYRS